MDAMIPTFLSRRILCGLALALLCQCNLVAPPKVIYALSPQKDLPSPLANQLTPNGAPIAFSPNRFLLSHRQLAALRTQAESWQSDTPTLLVLGFARRGLPSSYARVLSQRRAEAVRQALIDQGIDAAKVHTAGYGHDQPGLSAADEVRLFVVK